MKVSIRSFTEKIIYIFVLATSFVLLPNFVFAESADGTINSIYKYAWSENIAWINFGLNEGNAHVTDSAISGYAWASNYGWINLNPPGSGVKNNGAGALSGSAWGENTGWIDFAGVSIDSDGYFSGYANGDVTGQISFNCSNTSSCDLSDFKVQTDWRHQANRTRCNNAIDDDGDGLIDYPNDSGCESLEDDDETNLLIPTPGNPPKPPVIFLINDGDEYTNSRNVILNLYSGGDVKNISVSNSLDFSGVSQILFQNKVEWDLCGLNEDICDDSEFKVYVKFYTKYGASSKVVSDSIILDTTPPNLKIDKVKDYYNENENIILSGKSERNIEVILHWNKKYSLIKTDSNGYFDIGLGKMPAGDYSFDITAKDLAGNKSPLEIIEFTVQSFKKEEEVVKKEERKEVAKEESTTKEEEATPEVAPEPPVGEPQKEETILEKIEKIAEKIIDKIVDFIKPPEKKETQKIVTIPEEPTFVFKKKWNLLPKEAIDRFALAPLPKEFKKLAEKFPELGKTFEEVGVKKITDLDKLESVKLTLPGLTERMGIPFGEIKSGDLAFPKSIPLAELSSQLKQQLPSEIIFAKTGGELIDFNITLSINEEGRPQQKISTVSGKQLHLVVKPDQPVKSVKGYLVLRSKVKSPKHALSLSNGSKVLEFNLSNLLSSLIFTKPVFAVSQEKPVKVEEKLVLMEFEYTDPDKDGIYTAEIQTPSVEGEYEIITVLEFEDPELGRKEIRLITVVDPEGYIYESANGKETRIPGAIVALYSLNPATKQYEIWPAEQYQQENPQVTNNTGKYSFLVPQGFYYLKVDAPGYLPYEGKPFEVKEGSGVHENIELKTKYWWIKIVDWKTVALIVVILFLMYNFYRDRKRERNLKHEIFVPSKSPRPAGEEESNVNPVILSDLNHELKKTEKFDNCVNNEDK